MRMKEDRLLAWCMEHDTGSKAYNSSSSSSSSSTGTTRSPHVSTQHPQPSPCHFNVS